jgi:hypothetical protein
MFAQRALRILTSFCEEKNMKTPQILLILALALLFMVTTATVSEAAPMGTAFTYQGRLIDANEAADGLYDFQFELYDEPADGNNVGGTIEANELEVSDGYFTVVLDFGAGVFDGDARWLAVGVRHGALEDPNSYVPLDPRQEVTPTPYALHAETVSSVPGSGTENYIAKFTDSNTIGDSVIYESDFPPGWLGIGTTSPEATLHIEDGDIKITGLSGTTDRVLLSGNSNWPYLELRCDGTGEVTRISTCSLWDTYFSSNVGIGTTSPGAKLEVNGSIKITDGSQGAGKVLTSDASGLASWQTLSPGSDSDWMVSGNEMYSIPSGHVGIGTTSPSSKLHVEFDSGSTSPVMFASSVYIKNKNLTKNNHAALIFGSPASSRAAAIQCKFTDHTSGSTNADLSFWTVYDQGLHSPMVIKDTGYVGIGTTSPSYPLEMGSGAHCTAGGVWTDASSADLKENFTEVDGADVLAKLQELPITRWNYKAEDPAIQHMGPVAEDFHALFGLGDGDKAISGVDRSGVALAAIQGLYQMVQEKEAEIAELRARLAAVEAAMGKLSGQQEGGV